MGAGLLKGILILNKRRQKKVRRSYYAALASHSDMFLVDSVSHVDLLFWWTLCYRRTLCSMWTCCSVGFGVSASPGLPGGLSVPGRPGEPVVLVLDLRLEC